MSSLEEFLSNPVYMIPVLFMILALGILLGKIQVKGCSLGTSGVLFVAILFGHFGANIPSYISEIGVVLFVYAVGLQAGPRFFKMFRSQGVSFAMLAVVTLVSGVLVTLLIERIFHFGPALSSGLFTGSLTSTPGLAAAIDASPQGVDSDLWAGSVSVGYGIAYPFGVAGVVLFVQLFPRLLKIDLKKLGESERQATAIATKPQGAWYVVANKQVVGLTPSQIMEMHITDASITRLERDGERAFSASEEEKLRLDDRIWVVVKPGKDKVIETMIGPKDLNKEAPSPGTGDIVSRDIYVTEDKISGKSLADLHAREQYGVVVSRLIREEMEFIPRGSTRLEVGDLIRVVGSKEAIERFVQLVGNLDRKLHETNFLPLCIGLVIGVLLGNQQVSVPGTDLSLKLGAAGGPLFVALIAGHFGRVGPLSIRMPVATKIFIRELGLMFFLAGAGVKAGGSFIDVLQQQGPMLFIAGILITIIPMFVAWAFARKVLKLEILSSLGAICGGMTSTPALGALSAASESESPAVAYATVYPAALVLVTGFAQILALMMIRFLE